jgi:large subunit ribosomal protein L25
MEVALDAVRRDQFGRNNAGRLRRQGQIPAVLYGGPERRGEPIAVDPKVLLRILRQQGVNTLISLNLPDAGTAKVLVKEYQLHPVQQVLLHADFYRVAMDKVLQVTVPVHLTGVAKGIKQQGGILDFVHRELVVECLPGNIPEEIVVDVTELMLHDGVRVRDLPTGGAWTPVSDGDMLIVHLVSPRAEVAAEADAAAATAAAAAEPEVVKKGKTEKPDEKAEGKKAEGKKE